MGKEILTYDDLLQIVQLIKSAEAFSEFHLKVGDIELDLRKATGSILPLPEAQTVAPSPSPATIPPEPAPPAPRPASAAASIDIPADAVVVASPMVGTFYRRPEPGARPFVEVGDTVEPDTIVCIIEVMKLMNSIPAGCAGRVAHILADDAQPIEAGQKLIVIEPRR